MTKEQLSKATELALSKESLINEDIGIFYGFGLDTFNPIVCTIRQLAALVRWQAIMLNGAIHGEALNEIAIEGRRKFQVI